MVNSTLYAPSRPTIKPIAYFTKSGDLITCGPGHVFEKFVGNVRLKAHESRRMLIGSSNCPAPPKGFSVELRPMKMPEGTIQYQITAEGSSKRYVYILNITNCSDRPVLAQVWQL